MYFQNTKKKKNLLWENTRSKKCDNYPFSTSLIHSYNFEILMQIKIIYRHVMCQLPVCEYPMLRKKSANCSQMACQVTNTSSFHTHTHTHPTVPQLRSYLCQFSGILTLWSLNNHCIPPSFSLSLSPIFLFPLSYIYHFVTLNIKALHCSPWQLPPFNFIRQFKKKQSRE